MQHTEESCMAGNLFLKTELFKSCETLVMNKLKLVRAVALIACIFRFQFCNNNRSFVFGAPASSSKDLNFFLSFFFFFFFLEKGNLGWDSSSAG